MAIFPDFKDFSFQNSLIFPGFPEAFSNSLIIPGFPACKTPCIKVDQNKFWSVIVSVMSEYNPITSSLSETVPICSQSNPKMHPINLSSNKNEK